MGVGGGAGEQKGEETSWYVKEKIFLIKNCNIYIYIIYYNFYCMYILHMYVCIYCIYIYKVPPMAN